ncbi:MAG: hypothetical protein R3E96_06800 [Planctomycetota bacterium]
MAQLFVPMEILELQPASGLASELILSRYWPSEGFDECARAMLQLLSGQILVQASDGARQIWEVRLLGEPFHLGLDHRGQAFLEGRTPKARAELSAIAASLELAAEDRQEGLAGFYARPAPIEPPRAVRGLDRTSFILRRGLGFGLGAGLPWGVAMSMRESSTLSPGVIWAIALLALPAVGLAWAAWLWKSGRA